MLGRYNVLLISRPSSRPWFIKTRVLGKQYSTTISIHQKTTTHNDLSRIKQEIEGSYTEISQQHQEAHITPRITEKLVKLPGPHVYISNLTDPYFNLALESYIFDSMPTKPTNKNDSTKEVSGLNNNRLVLYKNSKCIVFGKNQNPWKEINFGYLKNCGLLGPHNHSTKPFEILRRNSGGGTVIHDDGNLNYCFVTTKNEFDRKTFSKIIVKEINNLHESFNASTGSFNTQQNGFFPKFPLFINERGDLVVRFSDTDKQLVAPTSLAEAKTEYKVSGSAYKVSKGRSYHHGTMLLNCHLDKFSDILAKTGSKENMIYDKSVDSTRAKIINLEMNETLFYFALIQGFVKAFGVPHNDLQDNPLPFDNAISEILPLELQANVLKDKYVGLTVFHSIEELPQEVINIANELKLWEFKFGKTPKFTHKFQEDSLNVEFELFVEKGYITKLGLSVLNERIPLEANIQQSIDNLRFAVDNSKVKYTAENINEFILDKRLQLWISKVIL